MTKDGEDMLKGMLSRHIQRFIDAYPEHDLMHKTWKALINGPTLDFTVAALGEESLSALSEGAHTYQTKNFPGFFVIASAIPCGNLSEAPGYFDGGYLGFLNAIFEESGYMSGGINLAHWTLCSSPEETPSVHLTFIPDKFLAGQKTISLMAQDLMTESEKREMGMES